MRRRVRARSACTSTWPTRGTLPPGRKIARAAGFSASCAPPIACAIRAVTGKPSRASVIAGCMTTASGSLPKRFHATTRPRTSPGTPAERMPRVDCCASTLPATTYMSSVAAAGAISRMSKVVVLPSIATTMKPPPPSPELHGSTTDSANDTASAASTALPPAARMARPASVASGCALATMACSPWVGAGQCARADDVASRTVATRVESNREASARMAGTVASNEHLYKRVRPR